MGYPSYMEDIIDRWNDGLNDFTPLAETPDLDPEVKARILAYLEKGKQILRDLQSHLDLATDPDLNLAAELIKERGLRLKSQHQVVAKQKATNERLNEIALKEAIISSQKTDLKTLKKRILQKEKELDDLKAQYDEALKANPEAAYELYSAPETQKRYKPDP